MRNNNDAKESQKEKPSNLQSFRKKTNKSEYPNKVKMKIKRNEFEKRNKFECIQHQK